MLDKVKEYFDNQYRELKNVLEQKKENKGWYTWSTEREFVNRTIQDCLAITMFAQTIGVEYKDVAPLYDELKEKCESLLTQ